MTQNLVKMGDFRLGAQVFIEPGQDKKRVAKWFELLAEHGLTTSRIRLFEDHIREGDHWNYEIYDYAFDMAARQHIKLLVTFFPSDDSVGGFKFPRDEKHLDEIAKYINNVVEHFKDHPALDCWVLQNEPGVEERTKEELAWSKYQTWLAKKGKRTPDWDFMNWELFFRDYTTWYLKWLADQVRSIDDKNLIHVNNHQLFTNLTQYDFKNWQSFLSTLGVSIHASWHLQFFKRKQYTMAISAHCDIIRHASFPNPFWVTELQGGNNLFSGYEPMSVYKNDIAQWIWTGIMSGAERIIFWTLNQRGRGHETGEWGMITYQDEPTERLLMSKKIAKVVSDNNLIFKNSKPLKPVVTLLYSIKSMITLEKVMSNGFNDNYKGRKQGAHILSVLAYYEVLLELGVAVEIAEIDDFNWLECPPGHAIILANAVALADTNIEAIYNFVESGNKLIMTGMCGFFDEKMQNVYQQTSPFKDLTGADLKGFEFVGEFSEVDTGDIKLPVHMLIGELKNYTGEVISSINDKIAGIRNNYGKGEVVWIPSLIGLGAWQNNNEPLAEFLSTELSKNLDSLPFLFDRHLPGIIMKTLESKKDYLSMIVNSSKTTVEIPIRMKRAKKVEVLFGESLYDGEKLLIGSGDTLIVKW
jgi:beta-galactosidase